MLLMKLVCIHTTQAYDLNYAGIIFGNEITYDKTKNEIVILKENYFDRNGQVGISDINDLKGFITNIYKTIMLRGIKGTYVYVCDNNLREYFANYIAKYKITATINYLSKSKVIPFENAVPMYDLKASAGNFSDLQKIDVSDFEWIVLPSRYKPSKDLFVCKVEGESMNKVIPNGSICLFRRYSAAQEMAKLFLLSILTFKILTLVPDIP